MKTISSIDQLAGVMIKVLGACEEPLDHADFCESMISCAVTVASNDGADDKAIFDMVIRSATAALVTIRSREKLQQLRATLEVH